MNELFDYGDLELPPSEEVIVHGLEEELMTTDWRQRAYEHFQKAEGKGDAGYGQGIGALLFATTFEKTIKSRAAEINYWEARLQLEHSEPDD